MDITSLLVVYIKALALVAAGVVVGFCIKQLWDGWSHSRVARGLILVVAIPPLAVVFFMSAIGVFK